MAEALDGKMWLNVIFTAHIECLRVPSHTAQPRCLLETSITFNECAPRTVDWPESSFSLLIDCTLILIRSSCHTHHTIVSYHPRRVCTSFVSFVSFSFAFQPHFPHFRNVSARLGKRCVPNLSSILKYLTQKLVHALSDSYST